MNTEHGTEILRTMIRAMALLNNSVAKMQNQMSESEFVIYKQKVASIMGAISTDIIAEIYQEFPYFEPNDVDEWREAGGLDLPNWLES